MDTHLGWTTTSHPHLRSQVNGARGYDEEVLLGRSFFAGLAAFVAIWTFMLAALMAASIADNIKPAEAEIDVAKIAPPVPSFTPVPEAPSAVYSLPAMDGSAAPPVWTPAVEDVSPTLDARREDQITIERNSQTNMPTKITIIGRKESADTPNVIAPETTVRIDPVRVAPLPRSAEAAPPQPSAVAAANQDAAVRVIDDIF